MSAVNTASAGRHARRGKALAHALPGTGNQAAEVGAPYAARLALEHEIIVRRRIAQRRPDPPMCALQ
jgi:hypothetical protein